MLKIRLQGTLTDIAWFKRVLNEDKQIDITEFSKPFANKGTSKHFRVYAEIKESKN